MNKKPRYSGYFRSEWLKILLVIVLTVLFTAGNFVETLLLSDVVDNVAQTSTTFASILWLAIILLAIELAGRTASFVTDRLVLRIKASVIKGIYWDLARAFANSSVESVTRHDPAEITERISEGKTYVDSIYSLFQEAFSLLIGIAAIVYTACCAWQVAILLTVFMLLILLTQSCFRSKLDWANKEARTASEKSKQMLLEIVSGFPDVKVQNLIRGLRYHLIGAHETEVKENVAAEAIFQKNSYISQIIMAIYKFSFLVLSGYLLFEEKISFAQFVALFMYKGYIGTTVFSILKITKYSSLCKTSMRRMDEILEHQKISKEKFGHRRNTDFFGEVKVENLTVRIGGNTILKDISTEIPPNSFIGIVGGSGSGKSTLLKVLSKQITPSYGSIIVDGVKLSELDQHSFRKAIRLAPQQPFLFSFSIRENLLIANPNASDEQIWDALRQCCADGFVRDKGGLDTVVSPKDLSGGERQRLALARTVLAGGKIILLDESTSALDSESQSAIVDTILSAKRNHTIVLVAHRVGTLKKADKILLMEDGQIVATGTYDELYESSEKFRYMAEQG